MLTFFDCGCLYERGWIILVLEYMRIRKMIRVVNSRIITYRFIGIVKLQALSWSWQKMHFNFRSPRNRI